MFSDGNNKVLELSDGNFKDFLMSDYKVAVVDFWADWCGPCRKLSPILDEIAKQDDIIANNVIVGKLNVDESSLVSSSYNIRSLPTIVIFKDEKEIERITGLCSKEELLNRINKYL